MALSNTSILYIFELAIYLLVFPLTLYLGHRHGRHAFLAYLYLNLFCAVRIAADIVELIDRNDSKTHPSIVATILGSIGLNPLVLAFAGLLHETHHHLLNAACADKAKVKRTTYWLYFAQLQIHIVSVTGMVLVIIGSIHLVQAKTTADVKKGDKLRSAGALMFLFVWLGVAQYAGWLFNQCRKAQIQLRSSVPELAKWNLAALPFIGIKVAYAMVYSFDHTNTSISPVTGSFVVKLLLVVGVGLLAVLVMVAGGWSSRDISSAIVSPEKERLDSETGAYEPMRGIAR